MNQQVKNLYDGLNLSTVPEIIKEEFFKLSKVWDNKWEVQPFMTKYIFDDEELTFFILDKQLENFNTFIEKKQVLDEDFNLLTEDSYFDTYIREYGRGFFKGYSDFTQKLSNEHSVFLAENRQTAHTVYSRVIGNVLTIRKGELTLSMIPRKRVEELKKKFNSRILNYVSKEDHYKSGYQGGEYYKAWSLILHNPTLFEEIFNKQNPKNSQEAETIPIIETPDLSLKNIPNFNLQQRFDIFKRLGLDIKILQIDTDKQTSTHKVLALIMGISPDNAKHLLNNTYKDYKLDDLENLEEYLARIQVKL